MELERSTHLSAIKQAHQQFYALSLVNSLLLAGNSSTSEVPYRRSLSAVQSGAKKGRVCLHDGVEGGRCVRWARGRESA